MRILSPVVFVFALLLIGLPWMPARAQTRPAQSTVDRFDLNEMSHRLDAIDKLDIQYRITALEQIQKDERDESLWHKGSSVGTGLLLIEAAIRTARNRKKAEEE